jgi:hypothetical protein
MREVPEGIFGDGRDVVSRKQRLQRLAVEDVETGVRATAAAALLPRRLIETTPFVCENSWI